MANRRRGEIEAELSGRTLVLCLTLGALAELEEAFAADDLVALVKRFEDGRLSARDLIRIIGCGLRGGGTPISDAEVAALTAPDGVAGFARLAADLLAATFGTGALPGPNANPP
jgi:hypothetical protein